MTLKIYLSHGSTVVYEPAYYNSYEVRSSCLVVRLHNGICYYPLNSIEFFEALR